MSGYRCTSIQLMKACYMKAGNHKTPFQSLQSHESSPCIGNLIDVIPNGFEKIGFISDTFHILGKVCRYLLLVL